MLSAYIRIARVDHWFKNIFMLPGTVLAIVFLELDIQDAVIPTILGVLSTCFVASANYVINEWLDSEFDKHHPLKKNRPGASGELKAAYIWLEYILIASLGLGIAASLSTQFLVFSFALLFMGALYNIKPIRTKDRLYLDVLSESVNNPLRFMLGWSAIASGSFPPSSILLAYWMGGAFLMGVKRYAEYRFIDDPDRAGLYRRSFQYYTEESLLLSSFFYALSSVFFLGIFLIKYRVEFLLAFPLFAMLFTWYLSMGMRKHSPTQNPENIYKEKYFVSFVAFLVVCVAVLFFVDIPALHILLESVR